MKMQLGKGFMIIVQRLIQNSVEHLRWSFLDMQLGSKYAIVFDWKTIMQQAYSSDNFYF